MVAADKYNVVISFVLKKKKKKKKKKQNSEIRVYGC